MAEKKTIPEHVAFILDGNGRWAKKRGMPRTFGHLEGCRNVEPVCRACYEMGIRYVTMYAFSTENWKRPADEVKELMRLLEKYMIDAIDLSKKNNFRIRIIGDKSGLSERLQEVIGKVEEFSKDFTGLQLTIAVNYGGRDEIRRAVSKLVKEGNPDVTEEMISGALDTAGIPDPDLMIRTSGEQRLSNYLMWQLAYSELYFTDTLWPDFGKKDLEEALAFYAGRDRRYGGVK